MDTGSNHPAEQLGVIVGLDGIVCLDTGEFGAPEGDLLEEARVLEEEAGCGRQCTDGCLSRTLFLGRALLFWFPMPDWGVPSDLPKCVPGVLRAWRS